MIQQITEVSRGASRILFFLSILHNNCSNMQCLSARDVENRISGPTIIQFDGVDVSRRPKCDCNHDYGFQYFFFTEVSRGASRFSLLFFEHFTQKLLNTYEIQHK